MNSSSGYEEIPHTADWALRVWAQDLNGLLLNAAQGMYAMMETRLESGPRMEVEVRLSSADAESLLVRFLGELLFVAEEQGLGFDRFDLRLDGLKLSARLSGTMIASQSKLIKAVTYHKLEVVKTPSGMETTIVFDV